MFIIACTLTYFSCGGIRSILKCRDNNVDFLVLLLAGIKSSFANLLIHFFVNRVVTKNRDVLPRHVAAQEQDGHNTSGHWN